MDTSQVVVRPAPPFEHPGRWGRSCECADGVATPQPRVLRPAPPAPEPGRVEVPARAVAADAVAAREFAVAAMTVVLEVVDRRRPVTALRPLVAPPVIDHVISRGRSRYDARLAAQSAGQATPGLRLRRVHIQLAADGQAEFFGTYTSGERVRAFAGRLARVRTKKGARTPSWRIQGLMVD